MRVMIEASPSWASARTLLVQLGRLGYVVNHWRVEGLDVYVIGDWEL